MSNTSFTEILTSLYNGNRGEARQAAEVVRYDNAYDLSEDFNRQRQNRINYETVIFKNRIAYQKAM